jgi:hypothetical protein
MYSTEIKLRDGLNEGYLYFCDKEHPLATGNAGMVLLHRHIASIAAGRWVSLEEVVHHIDENKLNNHPSNLQILSRSKHASLHKPRVLVEVVCLYCENLFQPAESSTKYCSKTCHSMGQVKNKNIDKKELEQDIWTQPYSCLISKYGLSDVGIKKRAIALGCKIPPPYFHNKSKEYREHLRTIEKI